MVQRIIHLENAGAVTIFRQPFRVTRRKTPSSQAQKLVRRHVAKSSVALRERRQIFNARRSVNSHTQRREIRTERVGNGLRSSISNRPADCMGGSGEDHPKGGAERFV